MFQTWILDKEEIGGFARELLSARQSGIMLAGMNPEAREAMVVDRAIQALFDAGRRALYKRRLDPEDPAPAEEVADVKPKRKRKQ
jgi:hypothetical protein